MQAIETRHPDPFAVRPAGHFAALDVTNAEYHGNCDGVSNSMLSTFLDDPALFHGYGPAPVTISFSRPLPQQRRQLQAWKLPVGNGERAGEEP